eukprot:scaffold206142_cov55-Attheya_sp.AAC.1
MVFQSKISFRPPERHPRALLLGGVSSSMVSGSMSFNDGDSDSNSSDSMSSSCGSNRSGISDLTADSALKQAIRFLSEVDTNVPECNRPIPFMVVYYDDESMTTSQTQRELSSSSKSNTVLIKVREEEPHTLEA